MLNFKTEAEIRARILYVEERIERVNSEINKQLILPFFNRNSLVCLFLSIEKKKYISMLAELKWIINE